MSSTAAVSEDIPEIPDIPQENLDSQVDKKENGKETKENAENEENEDEGDLVGGSKTLGTAWSSFPMIREALDGILDVHDKECSGEGWLPPHIYKKTVEKASSLVQTSVKTTKTLTIKTKGTLPKVVQNGLESGVNLADNLGAKSLSIVAEKVPLVGEPGCVAKEKALNTGRKISQNMSSFVAETWIGQKTLGAIDSTLTLTEKPLAYLGNVNLSNKNLDNSLDSRPASCKKSMQLKVEEKSSHYKLNVYTFGLHGKIVSTARYILKKIRRTRRNVRTTKSAGLKVLIKKEKLNTRKKLTPRKRIVNISSVGTVGYFANLLQVNLLLKLFGLQIIPSEDVRLTHHIIFPSNSKLVPKNFHNSIIVDDETPKRGSMDKIRGKRCRKSESSEGGSVSDPQWNDELEELTDKEDIDAEFSENELANTSLESLDSFEDTSTLPTNEHDSEVENVAISTEESNKSKQSSNLENPVNVSEISESQGHDESHQEAN